MLTIGSDGRFSSPCVLVLGGFDGLHLGHRALLLRAKEAGLPVGITTIFGGKGKALFTRSEREFLFARAGVAFAYEMKFTEKMRSTSAEDFIREIFSKIAAKKVVCGEDFRFGRDALGTADHLKRLAPCPVEVVPAVSSDWMHTKTEGIPLGKISTTACKKYLASGELPLLNACLQTTDFYGSAYFLQGTVEHGRQVGRTYGFPTLNLSVPSEKLLPPDGVYGGLCATPEGNFPTIINIGARPTFDVVERKVEAYLDGFSGDLYGASVRIYPVEFYRGIRKFADAEALKFQLQEDIQRLRDDMRDVKCGIHVRD